VRKLTRRLGAEVVAELSRAVIAKARRERRFRARAVRIDSTVVEANVRYPTDAGLAGDGVRGAGARGLAARCQAGRGAGEGRGSLAGVGKRLRAIARSLRRRSGEAKAERHKTETQRRSPYSSYFPADPAPPAAGVYPGEVAILYS